MGKVAYAALAVLLTATSATAQSAGDVAHCDTLWGNSKQTSSHQTFIDRCYRLARGEQLSNADFEQWRREQGRFATPAKPPARERSGTPLQFRTIEDVYAAADRIFGRFLSAEQGERKQRWIARQIEIAQGRRYQYKIEVDGLR